MSIFIQGDFYSITNTLRVQYYNTESLGFFYPNLPENVFGDDKALGQRKNASELTEDGILLLWHILPTIIIARIDIGII